MAYRVVGVRRAGQVLLVEVCPDWDKVAGKCGCPSGGLHAMEQFGLPDGLDAAGVKAFAAKAAAEAQQTVRANAVAAPVQVTGVSLPGALD